MHRRRVLSGAAAAAALAAAGCAGGGDPRTATDGGEPTDRTGTETPADLSAVTFTPRESCSDPGGATVSLDADPVSVVGCVIGKNGCTRPRLASVERDAGDVTVVVAAVEERDDDEACTEALVNLGYEAEIDYADPPTSVTVVHDDVDGRRTVADVTR
ncbi:hypothetical protein [Halobellus ruber]|uniref:Uncharacterized protein n=1 Tax=Halobellus ruber TaxID=2761102 RepID=A0A7J9SH98_9EURY|nr:hypothetical protein [Halobellus ruber]MBB6646320.1 hypothetical protein [Halobellus ruber]